MPKREKLTRESKKQIAAAAEVTPSKLADLRAWCGSLSATKNAQGQNVKRGMEDAKEMLGGN